MEQTISQQLITQKRILNFTGVEDVSDINVLVKRAFQMKKNPLLYSEFGKNKTLVLLFFNPSLRTRLSTQLGGMNLGMSVISMNASQGWKIEFEDEVIMNGDTAEHIREAAKVVSQYADIIGMRCFPSLTNREKDYQDEVINGFVKFASVPVISLESAIRHPLQSLTDLMTIKEYQKSENPKVVLTWAPHLKSLPQAVANSFVEWMQKASVDLTITHPPGYELSPDFVKDTPVEYNQEKALREADFVYVKNWSSFESYGQRLGSHEDWMMSKTKMTFTKNAYLMHCLPVRRNVVIESDLLDSAASLVIQQANNRTFAAQAVLHEIIQGVKNQIDEKK